MIVPVAVLSDAGKKRIKAKHPWIFSNELAVRPDASPGDLVQVQDQGGRYVATGYYNPHTLIAIRILSFQKTFDLKERIQLALQARARHYGDNSVYRVIYSESDGIPGLIADRYNKTLVLQMLTAGIEKMRPQIVDALIDAVNPERILLRNDSAYRNLEGLDQKTEWIFGDPIAEEIVEMDGLKFWIQYESGQKTGFFLDQRENRKRLQHYGTAESLLDVYSFTGSWALYGAAAGIQEITTVDTSQEALQIAVRNAELNHFSLHTIADDGAEYLRKMAASAQRFSRIVLDPPAFCKSKRHLKSATRAYREINLRAMKCLKPGGILFTCSCSQPVTPEIFLNIIRQAAIASGRQFYLRELMFQPPDHPILMNFPESHYLKCAVLQVLGQTL
jgi:23S rRNA (cytosine1962-C5)-methyltransferase